jgi:Zn-dependent protease
MSGEIVAASPCRDCATDIGPSLLACPGCGSLVHAGTLKELSSRAAHAADARDLPGALQAWRAALELLPPDSAQHAIVRDRLAALSREADTAPTRAAGRWKWLAPIAVVAALASKGKLLVLGLTKASTMFSMLLSFGVYWTSFGPRFALGLIASIYVHEMGHVAALARFGIAASAPMFIPGFGALVRLRQAPLTPVEDARVGLAGPIWGTGAAIAAFALARYLGSPLWLAIAHVGAWLNLFNLLPVWQLDGSRAFAALTRAQRLNVAVVMGVAWVASREGLLILLAIVAAVRGWSTPAPDVGDRTAFVSLVSLVVILTVLTVAAAR